MENRPMDIEGQFVAEQLPDMRPSELRKSGVRPENIVIVERVVYRDKPAPATQTKAPVQAPERRKDGGKHDESWAGPIIFGVTMAILAFWMLVLITAPFRQ